MNHNLSSKWTRVNLIFILSLNMLMISLFLLQNFVYSTQIKKLIANKQQNLETQTAQRRDLNQTDSADEEIIWGSDLAPKRLASLEFWEVEELPADPKPKKHRLSAVIPLSPEEDYPTNYESEETASYDYEADHQSNSAPNNKNPEIYTRIIKQEGRISAGQTTQKAKTYFSQKASPKKNWDQIEISEQEKKDIWNCTSLNLGCNITPSIKFKREYFRLVTSVFLHDNLFHLSINVIFSLLYYPKDRFLIGQFFCVVLLLNLFSAFKFPNNVKIGFSGFALFCFGFSFLDQLARKKIYLLGKKNFYPENILKSIKFFRILESFSFIKDFYKN